jgi:hypothetical protein
MSALLIGYARVSTAGQVLTAQRRALAASQPATPPAVTVTFPAAARNRPAARATFRPAGETLAGTEPSYRLRMIVAASSSRWPFLMGRSIKRGVRCSALLPVVPDLAGDAE